MKQCCKCCAELSDNVWTLYEYNGSLYCYDCLLEKLIEDGVIQEVTEEAIDEMITIAEFILGVPEKLSKRSNKYKKLVQNKYNLQLEEKQKNNERVDWITRSDLEYELEVKFWKIWFVIFPVMWW